jgi:signal transduction histidine kinase
MSKNEVEDDMAEAIDYSREAVDRIQELIENTLEFSRKAQRGKKVVSINDIIVQAIEISKSVATKNSISIYTELQNDLPNLNLNKNKILQVIINLITNAIEASPKHSQITVRSYNCNDENYSIEVEDQGQGIKAESRDKIFNDFYTSKKNGTGLGLTVCKTLLNENGASIDFESEENKGTKFIIKFPQKLAE